MSMLAMDTVPVAAQHASLEEYETNPKAKMLDKTNALTSHVFEHCTKTKLRCEDCAAISRAHTPRYMRCSPSHPHKTYLTNLSNPGTGSLSSSSQAVKIFAPAFAANPNLDPQPKPQPQPQPVVEEPSY
ncbi:hypothetical protein V6N13_086918 [Hibiscus sabdariffa]